MEVPSLCTCPTCCLPGICFLVVCCFYSVLMSRCWAVAFALAKDAHLYGCFRFWPQRGSCLPLFPPHRKTLLSRPCWCPSVNPGWLPAERSQNRRRQRGGRGQLFAFWQEKQLTKASLSQVFAKGSLVFGFLMRGWNGQVLQLSFVSFGKNSLNIANMHVIIFNISTERHPGWLQWIWKQSCLLWLQPDLITVILSSGSFANK